MMLAKSVKELLQMLEPDHPLHVEVETLQDMYTTSEIALREAIADRKEAVGTAHRLEKELAELQLRFDRDALVCTAMAKDLLKERADHKAEREDHKATRAMWEVECDRTLDALEKQRVAKAELERQVGHGAQILAESGRLRTRVAELEHALKIGEGWGDATVSDWIALEDQKRVAESTLTSVRAELENLKRQHQRSESPWGQG